MSVTPRPLILCAACEAPLHPLGRLPVRRDAAEAGVLTPPQPGDTHPVIGIEAYRCHNCGRIELYDHDFLLPSL